MRVLNENDIDGVLTEGQRGNVLKSDLIDNEDFLFGLRYFEPGALCPQKPHRHSLKQLNYIISGSGKVTNLKETLDLKPGDIILLDSNEEHYFETKEGLRLVEIRYR